MQIGGYDSDDSLYLTTPRGTDVENPVPMIFDRNGTAVWVANSTYSNAFDMNTGDYNGSQYVHHSLDTSPNWILITQSTYRMDWNCLQQWTWRWRRKSSFWVRDSGTY